MRLIISSIPYIAISKAWGNSSSKAGKKLVVVLNNTVHVHLALVQNVAYSNSRQSIKRLKNSIWQLGCKCETFLESGARRGPSFIWGIQDTMRAPTVRRKSESFTYCYIHVHITLAESMSKFNCKQQHLTYSPDFGLHHFQEDTRPVG